jgi:hypothetical protein
LHFALAFSPGVDFSVTRASVQSAEEDDPDPFPPSWSISISIFVAFDHSPHAQVTVCRLSIFI